jgi:hypothetical protein
MTDTPVLQPGQPVELAPSKRQMDNRRRRAQRWIAVGSFCYLAAQGIALTGFLLVSEARGPIAAVFQGLTPFLIATNGMFVSVVLGYMGVSLVEKIQTGE